MESHPSPEPGQGSPASYAFDPYIARRLNTFVPIRKLDVPSRKTTWDDFKRMVNGWNEANALAETHEITTWDVSFLANVSLLDGH